MPPQTGYSGSSGLAVANGKAHKSLGIVQVENGYVVTIHFNSLPGSGDQHIAADLDAVQTIIKNYFEN